MGKINGVTGEASGTPSAARTSRRRLMMHHVVIPLIVALSLVLSLLVAIETWRRRRATGAGWLLATVCLGAWWVATVAVDLVIADPAVSAWLNALGWAGASFLAVCWFGFALAYTGRRAWLVPSVLTLVAIIPTVTVLLVLSEAPLAHDIVRAELHQVPVGAGALTGVEYGPWGLFQIAYAYVLVAVGAAVLLELAIEAREPYRSQGGLLIAAAVVPMLANTIGLAGVFPIEAVDPTPFAIGASAVFLLVGLRRHRLLRSIPVPTHIAYHTVFESLDAPVVVLNEHGQVVEANSAASVLAGGDVASLYGRPASALPGLDDAGERPAFAEVDGAGGRASFQLRSMPLEDATGRRYGTILLYQDITDLLAREQRLDVLNRVLRHDIRNEMSVVLGHARDGQREAGDGEHRFEAIERTAESILETTETAREIERLVRRASRPGRVGDLSTRLAEVQDKLKRSYPQARYDSVVEADPDTPVPVGFAPVIWHLVDNAVRHNAGDAPLVSVTVEADADALTCTVTDDGPGIPDDELAVFEAGRITALEHASGLGLWLVHWVVSAMGGHVDVSADASGTVVEVTVPIPAQP